MKKLFTILLVLITSIGYSQIDTVRIPIGGFGRGTDTISLSNRINSKLAIADTAGMLANYQSQININTGNIATNTTNIASNTSAIAGKENSLGNPSTNGYILSSTTAGARSWVANGSGGGSPSVYAPLVISNDSISQRFNVLSFNPNANNGITDATPAIQAAINAAVAAGGGTVFFPNGVYLLNGSLVNSGATGIGHPNSQLYLPLRTAYNGVSLELVGETPPCFIASTGTPYANSMSGAIIYSTIPGTGIFPSILSTDTSGFNTITITIKNLTFRVLSGISASGPTMSALNLHNVGQAILDNVSCDIDTTFYASVLPVAATFGIWMPANSNGAFSSINNTLTGGYRYGTILCEHSTGDNINADACVYGVVAVPGYHALSVGRVCVQWCNYAFSAPVEGFIPMTSYSMALNVRQLDIEWRSPGNWYYSKRMIYDSANVLTGTINYAIEPVGSLNYLGAKYINLINLRTPYTTTGQFSQLGIGTLPTSAPLTIQTTSVGSNNGVNINLASNNTGSPSLSYQSIDFSVPTTGKTGQFSATASNYNSGISLQPNSIGLDALSNQLWLAATNSSGYISLVTGGVGVNNERLRILGSGNFIFQNGGTYTDIPSAKVQFNSTTQGVLDPQLTTTQQNAISSPATGIHFFNTTLNRPSWFDGIAYRNPVWQTDSINVSLLQGTIPLSKIAPSNTILQRGLGHRGSAGNDTLFNYAHVATYTSASSININADTTDAVVVTALVTGLTLNTPTGIAYYDNQPLTIRIRDNGTSQTLTFGSGFSFSSSLAAPASTTAGKLIYMRFIYDAPDNVWLCVQKLDNFN